MLYLYIYIYIYIIAVQFPGSRAGKLAPPAGLPATKTILEVFQFQRCLLFVSKTPRLTSRGYVCSFSGCSSVSMAPQK